MRYLGSKTSLLDSIFSVTNEVCSSGTICDPFGGIGTVGHFFKKKGFRVITGDILNFAHCFQIAKIVCNEVPEFKCVKKYYDINGLENYLNNLEPKDGWLVEEYSNKRLFFSKLNAMKIQSCIDFIWNSFDKHLISELEYSFLIASLINSMDRVANTAGTYYAYLKQLNRKSKKEFNYQFLIPCVSALKCTSTLADANSLVKDIKCDILYLDPPYNERDYQRYYHLPENIARKCIPIPADNKSGVFIESDMKSSFNKKEQASKSFQDIVKYTQYKYLVFHYSDDGIIPQDTVKEVLSEMGKVDEYILECRAYVTSTDLKEVKHHLYRVTK